MITEEMNKKSVEELLKLLEELTNEQMKLKIKKAVNQLTAPHRLRIVRKNIARVKTILSMHELNQIKDEGNAA